MNSNFQINNLAISIRFAFPALVMGLISFNSCAEIKYVDQEVEITKTYTLKEGQPDLVITETGKVILDADKTNCWIDVDLPVWSFTKEGANKSLI